MAAGRLVLNVMGSVSQWEREAIGERTAEALTTKRARGERVSRFAPYGYRSDGNGRWLADPHEQRAVRLMRSWRTEGLSLRDIAARLERRGFLSRAGTRLSARTVRSVLIAEDC